MSTIKIYAEELANIRSANPNQAGNIPAGAWTSSISGNSGSVFARFRLPDDVPSSAVFSASNLAFATADPQNFTYVGNSSGSYMELRASPITGDWQGDTVTWNNAPAIDSNYVAFLVETYHTANTNYTINTSSHIHYLIRNDRYVEICLKVFSTSYGTTLSMDPSKWCLTITYSCSPYGSYVEESGTYDEPRPLYDYTDNAYLQFNYDSGEHTNINSYEIELYNHKDNLIHSLVDVKNIIPKRLQMGWVHATGSYFNYYLLSSAPSNFIQTVYTNLIYGASNVKLTSFHGYYCIRLYNSELGVAPGDVVSAGLYFRSNYGDTVKFWISTVYNSIPASYSSVTYLGNTMLTGAAPKNEDSFMRIDYYGYQIPLGVDNFYLVVGNNEGPINAQLDVPMMVKGSKSISQYNTKGVYSYNPPLKSLAVDNIYHWRYRLSNYTGTSDWSLYDYFTPVLSTPANMSAEPVPNIGGIKLNLPDISGDNLSELRIYRVVDGGERQLYDAIDPHITVYYDTAVKSDALYAYSYQLVTKDGVESPISNESYAMVQYQGSYLGGRRVLVQAMPEISYPRLMTKRYRLRGGFVTCDKGYGAAMLSVNIIFHDEVDKDEIIKLLSKSGDITFADSRGVVFKGTPYSTAISMFPVTSRQVGIINLVLEG